MGSLLLFTLILHRSNVQTELSISNSLYLTLTPVATALTLNAPPLALLLRI